MWDVQLHPSATHLDRILRADADSASQLPPAPRTSYGVPGNVSTSLLNWWIVTCFHVLTLGLANLAQKHRCFCITGLIRVFLNTWGSVHHHHQKGTALGSAPLLLRTESDWHSVASDWNRNVELRWLLPFFFAFGTSDTLQLDLLLPFPSVCYIWKGQCLFMYLHWLR